MEQELWLCQGETQAVAHDQLFDRIGIHIGAEELVDVSPQFLGPVHGSIGVLEQDVRIGAVLRITTDADAPGDG